MSDPSFDPSSGPLRDPAPGDAFGGQREAASPQEPDAGATAESRPSEEEQEVLEGELLLSDEVGVPATEELVEEDVFDPLAIAVRERDEFREALVRLQADFENYKKRVAKQQEEQRDRATEILIERLLPVLDTVDLALAHGGGEDVKQLGGALANALEKEGLERIDPTGDRFDPTLHEAVAHEAGDGGEQEVSEVLRAGYRWKGRVLRAAMVKVRG